MSKLGGESSYEHNLLISHKHDLNYNKPDELDRPIKNSARQEVSTRIDKSHSTYHEMLANINNKINFLDEEFKILSQAMEESCTDIYTEMLR